MEQYLSLIETSPLFHGVAEADVLPLLQRLKVRKKKYEKGEFLFYSGDAVPYIGLVLEGAVHIIQEDYWGNRNILSQIPAGFFFGEAFACLPDAPATVDVVAASDAVIMQVYVGNILHAGQVLTPDQARFTGNLLALMAEKNRLLTEKIRYLTQRSTRQKIMLYLSDMARKKREGHLRPAFQPPADGRLPLRRPQRLIGRTEQDEKRRPHRLPQGQIHLAAGTLRKSAGRQLSCPFWQLPYRYLVGQKGFQDGSYKPRATSHC
jgi:CRP-like cAMP-binding protein